MKPHLWLVVLFLAASLLPAQTSPSTKPGARARARAKTEAASSDDVKALRSAVAAQQQQMEQQRQQINELKGQIQQFMEASQRANAAAQAAESNVNQAQSAASQAQQAASEAQRIADQASANAVEAKTSLALIDTRAKDQDKRIGALQDVLGRFRFSGDVRIRGESFIQQGTQDRNRARVRLRFGLDGKLNEDFLGGFAIATGSLGDPTTTNETLTNAFDRKTIGLDRGYITYNPVAHNWLSLTGGKFSYLWQRTSVTGDPDISPEGFDEKFSFNLNGPIKNVTAQALELLYNESSGGQDSYALGGQISAKFQFGPWTATPSFLSLKWNRPDALLQASAFEVQATSTGSPATSTSAGEGPFPISGEGPGCAKVLGGPAFAPCPMAANGMTNGTFLDSKGNAHFYSGFNYADFILNNQIQDGIPRLPINILLEFEDNLDAEKHPLDSKGNVLGNLGSQNKEYGVDFSLGQLKNKNDVQFGYAWLRQEQDAVIASFAESDQRSPTNIIQNRIYALWRLRANTVAGFTWWHGRVLNSLLENNAALAQKTIKNAGDQEPYLNRLQFDLIYSF